MLPTKVFSSVLCSFNDLSCHFFQFKPFLFRRSLHRSHAHRTWPPRPPPLPVLVVYPPVLFTETQLQKTPQKRHSISLSLSLCAALSVSVLVVYHSPEPSYCKLLNTIALPLSLSLSLSQLCLCVSLCLLGVSIAHRIEEPRWRPVNGHSTLSAA